MTNQQAMILSGPIAEMVIQKIRRGDLGEAAQAIAGMREDSGEAFLSWTLNHCNRSTYYALRDLVEEARQ